jgi:hypothetical protein
LHRCDATKLALYPLKTSKYLDIHIYNIILYIKDEILERIKLCRGGRWRNIDLVGSTLMFKKVTTGYEVTTRCNTVLWRLPNITKKIRMTTAVRASMKIEKL